MATFYMDPDNGNDANDGTTFANRWKTLTSGATAARIAPGDTIRVIASPDPYSPGNATWTDNSGTVTWAAQKNKHVDDCDTVWTAATNITAALVTGTAVGRKQGAACMRLTPASGFTTGLMGYRTLPATLDLSAYEGISFWFRGGALTTAGQVELRLCSDTAGVTAVHTIALPALINGAWIAVVWDNGAALSSGINSVALYAMADPGTTAMHIDNIVACKASSSSDYVTHAHAIGKNSGGEPWWYSILAIEESAVELGGARSVATGSTSNAPRPYRGTTETVATYLLRGINGWLTSQYTIQDNGTDGSHIIFSGGWNRTDMSTQTGYTYLQGGHYLTNAIALSSKSFVTLERFGALNYGGSALNESTCSDVIFDFDQIVGCADGLSSASSSSRAATYKFKAIQGAVNALAFKAASSAGWVTVSGDRIHGSCTSSGTTTVSLSSETRLIVAAIDNNGGIGVAPSTSAYERYPEVVGCTFSNNGGTADVYNAQDATLLLTDCVYSSVSLSGARASRVRSTRDQGVATAHKTYTTYYTVQTATDQRHTASGVSWKVSPTGGGNLSSMDPAYVSLGKIAVNSGSLVTFKCWVRRDNTGLSVGIQIPRNCLPGVGNSDLRATMTAAANTWEELTLTFTPTAAGVFEVFGIAWGGTTYNAWFDDITPTQA